MLLCQVGELQHQLALLVPILYVQITTHSNTHILHSDHFLQCLRKTHHMLCCIWSCDMLLCQVGVLQHQLAHFVPKSRECMGVNGEALQLHAVCTFYCKPCKNLYQYYNSRENPYQYYKSRKNLYQVLQVTRESISVLQFMQEFVSVLQVTQESISGTTSHAHCI